MICDIDMVVLCCCYIFFVVAVYVVCLCGLFLYDDDDLISILQSAEFVSCCVWKKVLERARDIGYREEKKEEVQ